MKIGIDASNIRTGGGKKHLEEFVKNILNEFSNTSFVVVSNEKIILSFKNYASVKCISNPLLNSNSFLSFLSQLLFSNSYFKRNNCDFVFVPGGIFLSKFKPFFSMSQNMLPFDLNETKGFPLIKRLKFRLIKVLQINSFNRSNGVIFLTEYSKSSILKFLNKRINTSVIPHGIDSFDQNLYSLNRNKFEILYISDFLPYKHNYNVFKAISELIYEGHDLHLTLIGKTDNSQYFKMLKAFEAKENLKNNITILGQVPNEEISNFYKNASLFLFASTCENLPFIILEAISFGLPVITSNKKPMKDLVYGNNILFDSDDINSIKDVIMANLDFKKLKEVSEKNYSMSKQYSWKKNAIESLDFFTQNL